MDRCLTRHVRKAFAINSAFTRAFAENLTDNAAAVRPVLAALDVFQLPLPDKDEFIVGANCLLLFLNRYGLVLRFDTLRDGAPPPDHPHLLRPLWTLNQFGVRIELLPGIRPAGDSTVAHKLSLMLEREGISFDDIKGENVGFLPGTDFPVVLDRGGLRASEHRFFGKKRLRPGIADVMLLKSLSPHDTQAQFYAPLYAAAMRSLPKAGGGWDRAVDKADPARVANFMQYCAAQVALFEQGLPTLLENNWSGSRTLKKPIEKGLDGERVGAHYEASLVKTRRSSLAL